MTPFDTALTSLDGTPFDCSALAARAVLVVNIATKCGLAPQLEGLERLQQRFGESGFTVLGVPCNQFAGQEPGTPDDIKQTCSTTFGTTFPVTGKVDVNGRRRHPLFRRLAEAADADGNAGEIDWNFEKFLVAPSGRVVARFRSHTDPESEEVIQAIQGVLAGTDMSDAIWTTMPATEVRVGDRVRTRDLEFTVTRIDVSFFGRDDLIAFVEDSDQQWIKVPTPTKSPVEVAQF